MNYTNRMMKDSGAGAATEFDKCPECGAPRMYAPELNTIYDGVQRNVVYCSNPAAHGGRVKFWKRDDQAPRAEEPAAEKE